MRSPRPTSALLALSLLVAVMATGSVLAFAQSTEEAETAADEARRRANAASGLIDEAVANREEIERQLADSITRLNELSAELSLVGSNLDRITSQIGYADVELAGIESDIAIQAVDAYMTVLASPSVSMVNTKTVEKALVVSSVVEDVVADGRFTVGQLFEKREGLVALQATFLASQEQYRSLQEQVDAEVANYAALYEQADATVAAAIREADAADRQYRAALGAVEIAQAKEAERRRQENREANTSTTTTTSPPSTSPSSPTTTAPGTTSTTSGGGGGPWHHPPQVEQWRSLVQQFFPSHRVEEALRIIDCESNGDPNAVNPFSGAAGLFQFLPSTWVTTAHNAGYDGYSPFDPEANTASAAWLANRYEELGYYYWTPWNCKRVLN
ncbi:MAG: transglycosylase SLT domain-containing protein [Acidimicrobiia bacterium]